jgi:hypothetical protein
MKKEELAIKEIRNERIIQELQVFAVANKWHKVNDYPEVNGKISHEVWVSSAGIVTCFGISCDNEVIVWNKSF